VESKRSIEEKEEMCKKFAYTRNWSTFCFKII
jgi:hypothetical protein